MRQFATAVLALAVWMTGGLHLAAQAPPAAKGSAKRAYTPPKTPWGDPDFEGLWPAAMNIPFERPKNFGERATLTEEEFKQKLAQYDRSVTNSTRDQPGAHAPGNWREYFPPTRQASLVVDPPDGRVPAM